MNQSSGAYSCVRKTGGGAMRRKDRMKLVRGLLLTVTTLCSAALFYAAGDSAVKTFAGDRGQAV